MRELAGIAQPALEAIPTSERLRVMVEAVEHVMSRLGPTLPPEAVALIRTAIEVTRARGPASDVQPLIGQIDSTTSQVAPLPSNLLVTALDLLMSLDEPPTASEAANVLFCCADAMMLAQGFGRIITIDNELSSAACRDVIAQQRASLT